ncbi:MAG: YidC/Oxa1 family membrane protein insertase [Patescibacteria group bacterium]
MIELFYTALYEPLFNALIFIYDFLPFKDLGVAIIILTVFIKTVLFWPNYKSLKAQKKLQETQPALEEIKKKYKDDKEEQGRQLIEFYKKNKVNPFSSCLPLLIQLPILIALYRVFFSGIVVDPDTGIIISDQLAHLYGSLRDIYSATALNTTFLGIVDLTKTHNIVLAVLAGAAQFFSSKLLSSKKAPIKTKGSKDENMTAMINKQMLYFMPIITVVFGYQFPAGVTLYWLTNTLFTLGQQVIMLKFTGKKDKDNKPEIIPAKNNEITK